ncbi:unnamed protein product [Prunus armeniaca]
MAELFKGDAEPPLYFQSSTPLASHTWVSKNLSRLFHSSEVRNNAMKWFIFPNHSSAVLLEYRHLAKALHNHTNVGLGPTVLAHLYKNLHTTTLENPLKLSAPGAFWMIQIWLQVYFLELRFPDIVLPEDQVVAHSLMDMPFGGGKPPNYYLGAEVYHPNFCARQLDDLDVHKDCKCSVNKINKSVDALYPSWEPNSYISAYFDDWWKARFSSLTDASIVVKVLFDTWDAGTVLGESDARKFIVQLVKGINAQVIEDPSMIDNLGGQAVQDGEVIVTYVITAGDLELPFSDEEDDHDTLAEPIVEATPARKNKRKETTQAQDSVFHPESPGKRLRKRAVSESERAEKPAIVPTKTTETDEELQEAFEAEEIPTEVIAESIELAKKQQEAEHSTAAPAPEVEEDRTARILAVMPIHSLPGSSTTASFADPELAKFEAIDLDA